MSEVKFHWLFIKNHGYDAFGEHFGFEAAIVEDSKLNFRKKIKLEKVGFKWIGDSFLSYEDAEKYANQYYDAHSHRCCICNLFTQVSLIRGKIWYHNAERYIPFNGYVCEQCADGNDIVGKTIKTDGCGVAHEPRENFTEQALWTFPELANKNASI